MQTTTRNTIPVRHAVALAAGAATVNARRLVALRCGRTAMILQEAPRVGAALEVVAGMAAASGRRSPVGLPEFAAALEVLAREVPELTAWEADTLAREVWARTFAALAHNSPADGWG